MVGFANRLSEIPAVRGGGQNRGVEPPIRFTRWSAGWLQVRCWPYRKSGQMRKS